MAFENSAGINVYNHYGVRDTGGTVGVEHSKDSVHQLSLEITADSVNDGFLPPVVIPAKAHFLRAYITIDQAFVGLTAVNVGEKGAETTNGIPLVVADLAVGARVPAGPAVGTWAFNSSTGTTAAKAVGITKTGTATAGQGTLVLEFVYKAREVGG